jgi:hypothetical protein
VGRKIMKEKILLTRLLKFSQLWGLLKPYNLSW